MLLLQAVLLTGLLAAMAYAEEIVPILDAELNAPVVETAAKIVHFKEPAVDGLHFVETFDAEWDKRWTVSAADKFSGEWQRVLRTQEALVGDYGLRMMDANKHHAISTRLPTPLQTKDTGFVVSYEVKYEVPLTCGGSYIKLFDSNNNMDLATFDNDTPYLVMFGPDKCGSKTKVHFIVRQKLPSGKWSEHHLIDPPQVPSTPGTHVYTLRVNSDDTFEILIDNQVKSQGSLATRFDPVFTPENEIRDPYDIKPDNWVENELMSDPEAVKPDDWDEDEPPQIPDTSVQKPEGWLDDEPLEVPDEAATKPEEWNEELDGEWQRPTVPNVKCSGEAAAGCGVWKAPVIANTAYKGRWTAPMIPNPEYKGEWAPRIILNPDYFEPEALHSLSGSNIDAIGFELWTVNEGMLYDNIVLSKNYEAVEKFIGDTYTIRASVEAEQLSKDPVKSITDDFISPSLKNKLSLLLLDQPALAIGTLVITIAVTLWLMWRMMSLCLGGSKLKQAGQKVEKVSDDEKKAASELSEEEAETEKENAVVEKEAVPARGTRKRQGKPVAAD